MSDEQAGPAPQRNNAAMWSVICGGAALIAGWFCVLFFPLGVAAIVMGIKGLVDSRTIGRGTVTSIIGIVLGVAAMTLVPAVTVLIGSKSS